MKVPSVVVFFEKEGVWERICFEAPFHTSVPHTIDTVHNISPFQRYTVITNNPYSEAHLPSAGAVKHESQSRARMM